MDSKRINELLDSYYNGETSVEEERRLSDFLNEQDTEGVYAFEKRQFAFFNQERDADLSAGFDERLEARIKEQKAVPVYRLNHLKNWYSAAAVVLLAIGLSWWFFGIERVVWQEQVTFDEMKSEVMLTDGSIISLNQDSEVKYPDKFDHKREIFFHGEGFFEIEPDPGRPFLIHTDNSLIEVLGTSFNVRNYPEEPNIVVSVVSGKVSFTSIKNGEKERVVLVKGERVIYNKEHNRMVKSTVHHYNEIAWKTKNITFDDDLMSEVIEDLEGYFDVRIEAKDTTILNCHFKGHFQDPSLIGILDVLTYSMGLSYKVDESHYLLVGKGCINDTPVK